MIQEAVLTDKGQKRFAEKLQFNHSACEMHATKHSDSQSSRTLSGKGSSSTGSNVSSSSGRCRKGKKF